MRTMDSDTQPEGTTTNGQTRVYELDAYREILDHLSDSGRVLITGKELDNRPEIRVIKRSQTVWVCLDGVGGFDSDIFALTGIEALLEAHLGGYYAALVHREYLSDDIKSELSADGYAIGNDSV